jgi:hypothetical protein
MTMFRNRNSELSKLQRAVVSSTGFDLVPEFFLWCMLNHHGPVLVIMGYYRLVSTRPKLIQLDLNVRLGARSRGAHADVTIKFTTNMIIHFLQKLLLELN